MYLSEVAVLLALVPLTLAQTCNLSNALPYSATSPGGGSTNNTGNSLQASIDAAFVKCTTGCGTSVTCLNGCLSTACRTYCTSRSSSNCQSTCVADPCAAFYGSGSATPDAQALAVCYKSKSTGQCNALGGSACVKLKARADLTCTTSQQCYKEDNGNYFCLNDSTGDYVDYEGGTGNVRSGTYTSAGSSRPAASATGTSSRTTLSAGATTSATGTAARATSSSGTATAAATAATTSAARNSGGRNFGTDSIMGALGVLLAVLL